MEKLAWQLPVGLLLAVFVISLGVSSYNLYKEKSIEINDLKNELENARKQSYPPITTLLMGEYFKNKDIPLGEFSLVNHELINKTFDNCRIHGTVVIYLKKNIDLLNCDFAGDIESTFITTTNTSVMGTLALENCKFINCYFYNVSFIGSKNTIAKLKSMFTR